MATYHCSVKNGGKGSGLPHVNYILREGKYANGERKEELIYKEHGNLPLWAEESPQKFWQAADDRERSNARVYSEFELALPNELSHQENIELVQAFIKEHVGAHKVYTFAIHEKDATLNPGVKQPHAHVMFSERILDGYQRNEKQFFKRFNGKNIELGGCKKDGRFSDSCGTNNILKTRKAWETYLNKSLQRYGVTVDCSSLKHQYEKAVQENNQEKMLFLDRPPAQKLGARLAHIVSSEMKKSDEEKSQYIKTAPEKVQFHFIQREMRKLQDEMIELGKEERIFEHNQLEIKAIVRKTEEDVNLKAVDKHHLVKVIDEHIIAIDMQIANEQNILQNIKHDALNQNRILLIAQSVYTHGASKKVTNEFNALKKLRSQYEDEFNKFKNVPKPGFFEFAKKQKYNDDLQKFEKWDRDISIREQTNNKKINELKSILNTTEGKEKVGKLVDALTKRNEMRLKRIDGYRNEIKELSRQKMQLVRLKKTLVPHNDKLMIKGDLSRINILSQSKQIVSQLKLPEARTMGGISAKICNDRDQYEEYER